MDLLEQFLERTKFSSYEDFARNYKLRVPENFNYAYDVVDVIAEAEPDRRALVWCDDNGDERLFSMADISRESQRLANWLVSLGIGKGDPVMLIMRRHHCYWPLMMALHRIGAIAVPATNQLQVKDVVYRVKLGKIKMLVVLHDEAVMHTVEEAEKQTPLAVKAFCGGKGKVAEGWHDLDAESESFPADYHKRVTKNTDAMLSYFTSGTTGMPKIVRHNFLYPLGHICTARYWQNCKVGGLHWTIAETGWAKSSWGKLYGQWLAGSAIMVYDMERFHAERVLEVVSKYKVKTFCAPPTMYRMILQVPFEKSVWSNVVNCTVAGEPLTPELFNRWREATGLEMAEGFGQTETCIVVGVWAEMGMVNKPGSMGRPAPSYRTHLMRLDGTDCAVGEEGRIVIDTPDPIPPPGLFCGYAHDQERTAKVWCNNVYSTGDVAWRDEDGYYWFIGRDDDVIKSSGYRIGPFEVESVLLEHPAVQECAVLGVPDPDGRRGMIVKAIIVLKAGWEASADLTKDIQNFVKHTTAPYKYPRLIQYVDELPKTISGKIRRVELGKIHANA